MASPAAVPAKPASPAVAPSPTLRAVPGPAVGSPAGPTGDKSAAKPPSGAHGHRAQDERAVALTGFPPGVAAGCYGAVLSLWGNLFGPILAHQLGSDAQTIYVVFGVAAAAGACADAPCERRQRACTFQPPPPPPRRCSAEAALVAGASIAPMLPTEVPLPHLHVERLKADPRSVQPSSSTIVLKNLAYSTTVDDLKAWLDTLPVPPQSVDLHLQHGAHGGHSLKFSGVAFAQYASAEEAAVVMKHVHGSVWHGRTVKAEYKRVKVAAPGGGGLVPASPVMSPMLAGLIGSPLRDPIASPAAAAAFALAGMALTDTVPFLSLSGEPLPHGGGGLGAGGALPSSATAPGRGGASPALAGVAGGRTALSALTGARPPAVSSPTMPSSSSTASGAPATTASGRATSDGSGFAVSSGSHPPHSAPAAGPTGRTPRFTAAAREFSPSLGGAAGDAAGVAGFSLGAPAPTTTSIPAPAPAHRTTPQQRGAAGPKSPALAATIIPASPLAVAFAASMPPDLVEMGLGLPAHMAGLEQAVMLQPSHPPPAAAVGLAVDAPPPSSVAGAAAAGSGGSRRNSAGRGRTSSDTGEMPPLHGERHYTPRTPSPSPAACR